MRKTVIPLSLLLAVFLIGCSGQSGVMDDVLKDLSVFLDDGGLDEETVIAGLKEALTTGTSNAVKDVSRMDGYLGNPQIRIPVPEELRDAESALRKIGLGRYVDQFVLSMNRAAEAAAPQAADIFYRAVGRMTVQDAFDILNGHDTAATEYFEAQTRRELYGLFRPKVAVVMGETGVVRAYNSLMDQYTSLPFVQEEPVDLEGYVTDRSLDGLFFVVGEEERKIREDPAARVTELLRRVFGSSERNDINRR